ncbi:rod-determining factor RdfA [Haloarchaeobius sp. DYHT-AS-18]|uniref:rod-determining factor RdfA n=1 Tax=Haloarchaeobius sp. DYHT-AS-18 TaxID=3446117 RepID=UPI003EC029FC
MADESESTLSGRGKVSRLIERYNLGEETGADLVARWTGDGAERMSLRDLADYFNRKLLRAALQENGTHPHEDEVESYYLRLTNPDISAGDRIEIETQLESSGIDVDALLSDFVSYQSIRTYVKSRGAEYEQTTDEAQIEKDAESIERLRSRLESVADERIDRLERTGRISVGDYSLLVEATVLCSDCGNQYDIAEFFRNEGCDCESATNESA